MTARIAATAIAVLIVAALIALYVAHLLSTPPTVASGQVVGPTAQLTMKTEPAVGPQGGNKSWVSYLVRNQKGDWIHSTMFKLPAHSLVHVTIYQFDGDSGLRNPFLSQVHGTVGNRMLVNGKPMTSIDPEEASHTFAVPQMGLIVPLYGVPEEAPNQCEEGPCSLKQTHETISFAFRTGKPGHYRWQCFVPCAAGFLYGFGGPMQTIGYMDGFLEVT
ncbi:MAG TPA: hypothetical protein VFP23_05220 [Solirubrobacterales bacterium]|nr:hypothetical protein [Solirubrobacterales bacterium]